VVVPLYNEEESLPHLVEQLLAALRPSGERFELVLVNDGSSDRTAEVLERLSRDIPELVGVLLRKNYGQTAAMAAGFDVAQGEVIVSLDGDLQNDPADIPMLLAKLREGYDLVSGWRHQRQDAALQRKLPSKIANRLIGRVTGVRLHDYGCSLKAYKRDVLSDMRLYGELHRFLPALAFIEGARITEVKVNHRARQFGSSKYGIDRTFRVLMDLLTVWFMKRFLTRPMYVFGFGGLIAILLSLVASSYLLAVKLMGGDIANRPYSLLLWFLGWRGSNCSALGSLANYKSGLITKVRIDRSIASVKRCEADEMPEQPCDVVKSGTVRSPEPLLPPPAGQSHARHDATTEGQIDAPNMRPDARPKAVPLGLHSCQNARLVEG
jgi:glycosyltransferase involved in cell wall biosynthesis